jgi:Sec-independent protein translocase protein TatA
MDILGVGPLELLFILLIALIVLGPKDMMKSGKTIGMFLRKIVTSSSWQSIQQTSREIRNLPTKLIREAGLEDINDQLPTASDIRSKSKFVELDKDKNIEQEDISEWITPPQTIEPPSSDPAGEKSSVPETNSQDDHRSNDNPDLT